MDNSWERDAAVVEYNLVAGQTSGNRRHVGLDTSRLGCGYVETVGCFFLFASFLRMLLVFVYENSDVSSSVDVTLNGKKNM